MANLTGKTALVTGGSRGIGAAIVKRLAAEGAAVAFTYASSPGKADEIVKEVEAAGGRAAAIQADSADAEAVRGAVAQAIAAFGEIHILVNNAGIGINGPLEDFKLEDFDRSFAVNVRGVFVATQEVARQMKRGGRIITIGSVASERMPFPGSSVYSATKGAIVGLTRGLAHELGARGITINNVQPGPIDTDLNPSSGPAAPTMLSAMALKEYGRPEDVAAMVALLAGPDGGYITGAGLVLDGGFGA